MKKIIILTCLLSTFILLSVPAIPSMHITLAEESYQNKIENQILNLGIDQLEIKDSNLLSNKENIQTLLPTLIQSLLQKESRSVERPDNDDDPQPLFFPFLGIFIYGLILYIVLKIVFNIIKIIHGNIQTILQNIKTRIINLIQTIATLVITILTFIITVITTIIQLIITLTTKLINGTLTLATSLINGIITFGNILIDLILIVITGFFTILLIIFQGIANIIARIWAGIGVFFGLINDIIELILNTIFPNIMPHN